MKKISHEIIDDEFKTANINDGIFPVTIIEYYHNHVFKQKLKLNQTIHRLKVPFYAGGYYSQEDSETVIFLNHINKIINPGKKIFRLAIVCYHEARHSIQKTFDKYSYEGFLRDIDNYIRSSTPKDYSEYHDMHSYEIGANLYSVFKAKEYLKNKYPEYYEQQKEEIHQLEQRYYHDYMTYDASDTVERMFQTIKSKMRIHKATKIKSMDKISPILEMFFDENFSYKSIHEIIKHEKFSTLDKRIIYAVLSSKSFLENLTLSNLTEEELNLLSEALQYTNSMYQNQLKSIERVSKTNRITLIEYLKSQKTLVQKISYIDTCCTRLIRNKLKFSRNERKKKEHIKTIPVYLEETNRLVKRRSNKGYLTINVFYIIGTILSIFTIIYLLLT